MTNVVRTDYPDGSADGDLCLRIVRLFEELRAVDFLNLPPLNDAVHVGALERLIEQATPNTYVEFEYCGRTTRVYADERIEVRTSSALR